MTKARKLIEALASPGQPAFGRPDQNQHTIAALSQAIQQRKKVESVALWAQFQPLMSREAFLAALGKLAHDGVISRSGDTLLWVDTQPGEPAAVMPSAPR